ncbi:MAG: hypothetical protein E6J41_06925 [Chloroflexi bacterium]|nr:MAG: hypothetical protein E6J41_06925 [Chloroflexota bacterium]
MDSDTGKPRVALLGTGIMGAGMTARLLDEGFPVDVWDRTPATAAPLAERGATAHVEPADAVRPTASGRRWAPSGSRRPSGWSRRPRPGVATSPSWTRRCRERGSRHATAS